jgi:hypothetical protein
MKSDIFEKLSAYNNQTVSNEHEVFTAQGDCSECCSTIKECICCCSDCIDDL